MERYPETDTVVSALQPFNLLRLVPVLWKYGKILRIILNKNRAKWKKKFGKISLVIKMIIK